LGGGWLAGFERKEAAEFMKVALINPQHMFTRFWYLKNTFHPPGLLYLAAFACNSTFWRLLKGTDIHYT
jgi:hypothetical protein|tara:strand:+ start:347 stop:553 length:207 start_codon:yes stop_codon:yes gene_type:complete